MNHFKADYRLSPKFHLIGKISIGSTIFFKFRPKKRNIDRYKHKIGNFKRPNLLTDEKLKQKIKIQITWNKC